MGQYSEAPESARHEPRALAMLAGLGAASAAVYVAVAFGMRFSNEPADVAGFLVAFGALFALYAAAGVAARGLRPARRPLLLIFVFALVFRLVMLCAGLPRERLLAALTDDLKGRATGYSTFLIYDNDVWRYLWDGHLAGAGVSPAAVTPARAAELAEAGQPPYAGLLAEELWWDVLDNTSFHEYTTVYPPVAQLAFQLSHALAPGSVFVWKLLVVMADLATCWALVLLLGAVGRPRSEVLLWAWNPLVVKELAGSGHVDALMIALVTAAVWLLVTRRHAAALIALGASILAKLGSAALVVLFLRRTRPWSWPALAGVLGLGAVALLGELPQLAAGLAAYAREWVFNTGPWAAAAWLAALAGSSRPELWANAVTRGMALVMAVALPWTGSGSARSIVGTAFVLLAATALLNPSVMPWYLLWALPLAVAAGCRSWPVLTALSLLSYLHYCGAGDRSWWLWLEYGGFALALAAEAGLWRAARKRGTLRA